MAKDMFSIGYVLIKIRGVIIDKMLFKNEIFVPVL